MPAAYVQSASGDWSSGTTFTASITTSAANLLAVLVWVYSSNASDKFSSIADDASSTYTLIDVRSDAVGGVASSIRTFYVKNVSAGAKVVTVTATDGSLTGARVMIHEYSGCDTSSPLDQHTTANQNNPGTGADAVTTGSVTTTTNGQAIFAATLDVFQSGTAPSAGTGYTGRLSFTTNVLGASESQIQAAAGAIAGTFTAAVSDTNSNYQSAIATFKAEAVVPPDTRGAPLSTIFRLRGYRGY